jgi:hypothetical protein
MPHLWSSHSRSDWHRALDRYVDVIGNQNVQALPELDAWYRKELPALITRRDPAHLTLPELIRLTEWKMARGVWRAPNLVLVRGNAPDDVERWSFHALAAMPHPKAPIATLVKLAGVGPATASAVVAAAAPATYPFFDELVAAQVPTLGTVRWTLGYYVRYAEALRERASALGNGWTPAMVERALWAHVGGKAGTTTA